MARKRNHPQATAEEHVESGHGDHMEGRSQPVPETVTREEFTQFTANLTNTLNMQQKMMEEMMQRLARNEPTPAREVDAPHNKPRALEAPTQLDSIVRRSTDRRIVLKSIIKREVIALLNLNKEALG